MELNTEEAASPHTTQLKREKRRTTAGPWKNVAEFHKVYDWLFAETADATTCRRALSQMRVWHLRRSSLCPAAVLATAVIVEVQLKDAEAAADLQTLYASAFTRFFNYMSSIMQTHNMRTMYETARQLGLQSFVVDLRHICAHGQVLPPLEVLRSTAHYCLQWLRDYYWTALRTSMCDVDASCIRRKDRTQFDDNVSQLFGIYDSALECYMQGATNMKSSKRHLHGKRYAQLKAYYDERQVQALRHVFDNIVRDLASLVRRDVAIKDLLEIYIEALLKMKYFFTVHTEVTHNGAQLECLIAATQSLFRMLAVSGFIEEVFLALLEIAENPIADNSRRAGAGFWAQQIVAGFVAFRHCKQKYKGELDENPDFNAMHLTALNLENIPKKVRKLLNESGVNLKRTLIFGDSFRRPWVWVYERSFVEQHLEVLNEFTAPVLKRLLPLVEPMLTAEDIQSLRALIDVISGCKRTAFAFAETRNNKDNGLNDAAAIYTPNDLLQHFKDIGTIAENVDMEEYVQIAKVAQYGIWTVAPVDEAHNWSTCPLGRLPWE